jgi:hypothetical protein
LRGLGIGSNARSQILQIFEIYDVQPKFVYSNGVYYRSDPPSLDPSPAPAVRGTTTTQPPHRHIRTNARLLQV